MSKVLFAVGARPNFPKVAPILAALTPGCGLDPVLVHTGQHHDPSLSDVFFEDLRLPLPDRSMATEPGPRDQRLAAMTAAFMRVCDEEQPDAVVVVGDVDSTLACTLAAAQRNIPVAHVEAGLRSRDLTMPEEINRHAVDHLSDRLYTHCADADRNLDAEGIEHRCVSRVFLGGFPKYVFGWLAGKPFSARLTNRTRGEYKGWPIDEYELPTCRDGRLDSQNWEHDA